MLIPILPSVCEDVQCVLRPHRRGAGGRRRGQARRRAAGRRPSWKIRPETRHDSRRKLRCRFHAGMLFWARDIYGCRGLPYWFAAAYRRFPLAHFACHAYLADAAPVFHRGRALSIFGGIPPHRYLRGTRRRPANLARSCTVWKPRSSCLERLAAVVVLIAVSSFAFGNGSSRVTPGTSVREA